MSLQNLTYIKDRNHVGCRKELTPEMIEFIRECDCESISLQKGKWVDLSFLTSLATPLRKLKVLQSAAIDWRSIEKAPGIAELTIDGVVDSTVDFAEIGALRELSYWWGKNNYRSVYGHSKLEKLTLYGAKEEDFSLLAGMDNLKELRVVRGRFKNFDGLQKIRNLRCVKFDTVTGLRDISQLKEMPKLVRLGFTSCNKVEFPDQFVGVDSLRQFSLARQKNFETLKLLDGISTLEVLMLFEMSVMDGDIKRAESLVNLRKLLVDQRKHYNMDADSFSEKLEGLYGDYKVDI